MEDPLRSPHAYANGIDKAPVNIDSKVDAASTSFISSTVAGESTSQLNNDDNITNKSGDDDLFDLLLSPHAYVNGIDAGPTDNYATPIVPMK